MTVPLDDPDGGNATLDLVVDPDEVAVDGEVAIAIRNEGEAAIGVGREHHVERWDGASWERLEWPGSYGWPDDLPLVEPDDELELSTWPPDEAASRSPAGTARRSPSRSRGRRRRPPTTRAASCCTPPFLVNAVIRQATITRGADGPHRE